MSSNQKPDLIAVNEYGFYLVPSAYKKRDVPKVLFAGEVYEPRTLKLIRRLCGGGDVVSGGAFIGDFFPAISSGLAQGALLHSFEPAPLSREACEATIDLNHLSNVRLHPVAVGSAAGELPLRIARPGGGAMAARARISTEHVEGETLIVPVKTLDDLVPADRHVSVLHLDIEGHEAEAIKGAARIIAQCRPTIILETERLRQRLNYLKLIQGLCPEAGYRLAGKMERNTFFLPTVQST